MHLKGIVEEEIHYLIEQGELGALKEVLNEWQPVDIADLLADLEDQDRVILFRLLSHDSAADTFDYLDVSDQKKLVDALSQDELVAVLNEMSPDDRTALLEELPSQVTRKLMDLLRPDQKALAEKLIGHPKDSVGRLMTPHWLAVRPAWLVREVLEYIRRKGKDSETLNVIYVTDDRGKLLDDIRIQKILIADPDCRMSDLMDEKFHYLYATDSEEDAVALFQKLGRSALPVVDSHSELIGIVTIDDILDVAQEKSTEDMQRMGGTEALEEPYLETGVWAMVKKRGIWLIVLFLGGLLTATAMGYFEDQLAKAVVLAIFIPLIISSGGNSGSQAATLIIRAMSMGEVSIKDWWKIMKREILAGIFLGGILGVMGLGRVYLGAQFANYYGDHVFLVALTIAFSLVGVVLWGTLMGSMLPLLLKKVGQDPAVSSTPFIATLVDVTGIIIYFSIATFFLSGKMF